MSVNLEIDSATSYAVAYREGKPVATVRRRRVRENGPEWKIYKPDGSYWFHSTVPTGVASEIIARRIAFRLQQGV